MDIKITRTENPKVKPTDESKLGFGRIFTDHMFIVEYDKGIGWHDARIVPYGPLCLDPASPVFHYAQEIFEGTKAYRLPNGEVGSFRLIDNARRMNRSADRTCMPALDEDFQVEAISRLIDLDRDWVPSSEGTSLYIRPTMIADGKSLGAHSAERFIYFVICAPSGSYYPDGMKPVRIRIEQRYVRAVKGGMGRAKTGGNYAASFKATKEAMDAGFNQVLWLDGREQKYVEEVGAMNMMFVIDGKIVTAELGDTILPGVTRDSVITLAKDRDMIVEERRISVKELYEAHAEGRLTEAFGTGTAAVISPVGELQYMGESIIINNREIGSVAQMFYDILTGIQRQTVEDIHGWIAVIPHY
ncbi:MAG TPA: branched-chain amino acid aminotransferase [Clostridiaceae bacterium]|nr:branched-chain amino acid aminotransferase [Clostridiaceae bacterium]